MRMEGEGRGKRDEERERGRKGDSERFKTKEVIGSVVISYCNGRLNTYLPPINAVLLYQHRKSVSVAQLVTNALYCRQMMYMYCTCIE